MGEKNNVYMRNWNRDVTAPPLPQNEELTKLG